MEIANELRVVPLLAARGWEITGHSLGGGLASAASVVAGIHADTFNAAGLVRSTLMDGQGNELYPGALANYDAAHLGLIDAYYIDWDILSLIQDYWSIGIIGGPTYDPMVSAIGNRVLMDGPQDSAILFNMTPLFAIDVDPATDSPWDVLVSTLGGNLLVMVEAHSDYQYGLMVTEDFWGTITWDILGYE